MSYYELNKIKNERWRIYVDKDGGRKYWKSMGVAYEATINYSKLKFLSRHDTNGWNPIIAQG